MNKINWNTRIYTEEEFVEAWMNEDSIAAVARKLGLTIFGSTYKTLKSTAQNLGLPEVERVGRAWLKGKNISTNPAKPLIHYLTPNSNIGSSALKKKLFASGVFEKKCYRILPDGNQCGLSEWYGASIPLHLDHIDGDNQNNCLANLTILCMNCHGQTETYCRGKGKNSKRLASHKEKREAKKVMKQCLDCEEIVSRKAIRCRKHAGLVSSRTKTLWPDIDELLAMVKASNYSQVGIKLGVSDNAVRKHIAKHKGI